MRTPRLTRSKTSHDGPSSTGGKSTHQHSGSSPLAATPDDTFRTSFSDLQRPENRQMLRRHLTGHFPESQRRVSDELLQDFDLKERQKISRSRSSLLIHQLSEAAKSSSSTVNSAGNGNNNSNGLSPVRESEPSSTAIDIEQAITILQELKKTASPDQLVALHKALLPTRESTLSSARSPGLLPVNDSPTAHSSAPPARHRSLQPAGLATRGGPADDLLKKQDDEDINNVAPPRSSNGQGLVRDDWGTLRRSDRNSNTNKTTIAALDLADEQQAINNPAAAVRSSTPSESEEYCSTGFYRRGTLRITNGAVSPDPSISLRSVDLSHQTPEVRAFEGEEEVIEEAENEATPRAEEVPRMVEDGEDGDEEYFPVRESFIEASSPPCPPRHIDHDHQYDGRQESDLPDAAAAAPSPLAPSSTDRRPQQTDHAGQERLSSIKPAIVFPISYRLSKTSQGTLKPSPVDQQKKPDAVNEDMPLAKPIQAILNPSAMDQPKKTNGCVAPNPSPVDQPRKPDVFAFPDASSNPEMPRFAQRWSHRAQFISDEYVSDCVKTPYDEGDGNKASSCSDGENDAADREDSAAQALRRLNGESDLPSSREPRHRDSGTAWRYGRANTETLEHTKRLSQTHGKPLPRPAAPDTSSSLQQVKLRKSDSGYNSEASLREQSRVVARMVEQINATSGSTTTTPQHADEGVVVESEHAPSLYNVNEVLRRPSLLDDVADNNANAQSSTPTSKTPRPLLGLGSCGKKSTSTSPGGFSNADVSPSKAGAEASPTAPDAKKSRKLQKAMPESLRRKNKNKDKRKKAEMLALQDKQLAKFAEYPAVPNAVAQSFAQRPDSVVFDSSLPSPFNSSGTPADNDSNNATTHTQTADSEVARRANSHSSLTALPVVTPSPIRSKESEDTTRRSLGLHRKSDLTRRRSKSVPRAFPSHSKTHHSLDLRQYSCTNGDGTDICSENGPWGRKARNNAEEEYIPPFTDINSTARALGSNPYDISTHQFKRRIAVPGAVQQNQNLQSPHQIGSPPFPSQAGKSKYGVQLVGMEAAAASELGRLKSRDLAVAKGQLGGLDTPPRIATPRGPRVEKVRTSSSRSTGLGTAASVRSRALGLERPRSMYAESIPSLPDIPDKFQTNQQQGQPSSTTNAGTGSILTRMRVTETRSADSSPATAGNNINSSSTGHIGVNDLADPIADVIRRAVSHRKTSDSNAPAKKKRPEHSAVVEEARSVPFQRFQAPPPSLTLNIPARPAFQRASTETSTTSASIVIGVDVHGIEEQGPSSAPPPPQQQPMMLHKHGRQYSAPTGWEEPAALWRERRKSIGKSLGQEIAVDDADEEEGNAGPGRSLLERSPTIIISRPNEWPFRPQESAPSQQPTGSNSSTAAADPATAHAETYAALIGIAEPDDSENRPAKDDVDRTDSANTFVTARSTHSEHSDRQLPPLPLPPPLPSSISSSNNNNSNVMSPTKKARALPSLPVDNVKALPPLPIISNEGEEKARQFRPAAPQHQHHRSLPSKPASLVSHQTSSHRPHQSSSNATSPRPPLPQKSYTLHNLCAYDSNSNNNRTRDTSPGGRVQTPSGKFFPYKPKVNPKPRPLSIGAPSATITSAPSGLDAWSSSFFAVEFGESPVVSPTLGTFGVDHDDEDESRRVSALSELAADDEHGVGGEKKERSKTQQQQQQQQQQAERSSAVSQTLLDRYSGGLGFGYERGVGLYGGSAGMKAGGASASPSGPAKSGNERLNAGQGDRSAAPASGLVAAGLDLSDVPMFLRRLS